MRVSVVAILALAFVAPRAAGAQAPATLTAVGVGTVTQAPDRAVVAFRIETVDDRAARASAENDRIDGALDASLARAGVAPAAIRTSSYALTYNPRPAQPNPNLPVRYGYVLDRTIEVDVERTDAVGAIVDAGVAAGVTGVDGVTFALRDPRAAYRAALSAAVDDAEAQAQTLATAAHVRLGRIVAIEPGLAQPIGPFAMRAAAVAETTRIAPADLTTTATVTMRYAIASP